MEITKVTVASQRLTKSSTTRRSSRARLSRNDVILRGSSKLSLDDPDSPSLIIRKAVTLHLFKSNICSEMAYREFIEQYSPRYTNLRTESSEIAKKLTRSPSRSS